MKKIKLMLVAFVAMIGVNAMAQTGTSKFLYTKGGTSITIDGLPTDLVGTIENIEIPATIESLPVTEIKASAFAGDTKIVSVSFPASVATINASAFNGCTNLATVTFAENSDLSVIGNYAFGNTPSLTSLDFTNCAKMKDFTDAGVPFLNGAASLVNNYLTSITLNGETTNIGIALANVKNLATQNIANTKITKLVANALANDKKITALTVPVSCTAINANALKDTKIAELTIKCNQVGGVTIDATAATELTSLTFEGAFKGTLKTGAFTGSADLASVTFGAISGTLQAGAITMAEAAGTIKVGDLGATTIAAAFTTNSAKIDVEIASISAAITGLIAGNVGKVTVGDISAAVPVDAFGAPTSIEFGEIKTGGSLTTGYGAANETLTSLTFNKAIVTDGIAADAFTYATKLATVEFKGALAAGAVADGSFGDGTNYAGSANNFTAGKVYKLTVTYQPAAYTAAFGDEAFDDGTIQTALGGKSVKLVTNRTFSAAAAFATDYPNFYLVYVDAPAASATIKVYSNDSKTYYGKFICPGTAGDPNYKIAKTDAMVYSAYVDGTKIYMDPLRVVDGYYIVEAGQAVVVKATKADDVTATDAGLTATTIRCDNTGAIVNDIIGLAAPKAASTIFDNDCAEDETIYAIASIAANGLKWQTPEATVTLPKNTLYVIAKKSASGRLSIIWLDEENNATAIQGVKNVVEDGAIYNLAGQKVSASYKGVVIKNGKKMIQK